MKKILGIHGRGTDLSKGESAWFDRKIDFENRGYVIDLPQFDTAYDPTYESWEKTLKTLDIESYDCIVTTSHGGGVIINYLIENKLSVPKLIIVCPGKSINPKKNMGTFYTYLLKKDINLSSQVKEMYVLHSKDDDLVPIENGREISEKIGATFIECNGLGHKFRGEGIKLVNDLV